MVAIELIKKRYFRGKRLLLLKEAEDQRVNVKIKQLLRCSKYKKNLGLIET